MLLKKLAKKITAGITAAAFAFSLTFSAPATAEAGLIEDVVRIGVSAAISYNQMNKQFKSLNDTEEGRTMLLNHFKEQTGVNNDYSVNARMSRIMANLTNAVGKVDPSIHKKPYKYYVSASPELNAFCSLGHVMVVNIGAFDNLATDDEIAAIVGHEMGHGQKDHVIKGNKKQIQKLVTHQLGAAAVGAATGSNLGAFVASALANVTLKHDIAHGTRKQETEADNLAWEYMLHTDYNIGATAAVMQKLSELYGDKNKSNILNPSDHPDTGKRRDSYAKKLHEYSGKHVTAKNGTISIDGKFFMTAAATDSMSSPERSYFIFGNLAKAYHNGKNYSPARVVNGTIYLDDQAIVTPAYDDEDAYTLANRLNELLGHSVSEAA